LVGLKQGNFLENAIGCSKRTLKTTVATQLKILPVERLLFRQQTKNIKIGYINKLKGEYAFNKRCLTFNPETN